MMYSLLSSSISFDSNKWMHSYAHTNCTHCSQCLVKRKAKEEILVSIRFSSCKIPRNLFICKPMPIVIERKPRKIKQNIKIQINYHLLPFRNRGQRLEWDGKWMWRSKWHLKALTWFSYFFLHRDFRHMTKDKWALSGWTTYCVFNKPIAIERKWIFFLPLSVFNTEKKKERSSLNTNYRRM